MQTLFEGHCLRKAFPPEIRTGPRGKRILIIAPHQDDAAIGVAGTMLRAENAKKIKKIVYITNGSHKNDSQLIKLRKDEARSVWKCVPQVKLCFLDIPAHQVEVDENNIKKLKEEIDKFNPNAFFVPYFLDPPPDHRKSCELFYRAIEDLNSEVEVWSYQIISIFSPNVVVDTTETAKLKKQINGLWKSQNKKLDYSRLINARDIMNSFYYKKGGVRPKNQFAELFFVCSLNEYKDILERYFGDNNERS